eukprot:GFUD01019128.1.p1 GENE.GFUD01019128.1~~GFUD01019128.1.p1  ORF type:complete len:936 (+),score=293.78 GFUD01019128.1:31-2838(+)
MSKSKPKPKVEFHRVDVGGTCVNFPFAPYEIQIDYMRKVLECLQDGKNGLLESPTGTGKTLSLLCSSLAWLEKARAAVQLSRLQPEPDGGGGGGGEGGGNWSPPVRHKIIYSSRTHSQLSQAVAELARTSYRYMRVSILGSRDQLCVNPAVMEANNSREKLHMCQARVKSKTCTFHQNVEKSKERPELRDNEIMDIEDLHKLGKKHNFCPYYMSRELYQSADVIFLPYNYLLDHKIRSTLDIDFSGAVIIFDEAHNVQKLCEETASVNITGQDIALAVKDIEEAVEDLKNPNVGFDEADVAPKDLNESELLIIKDLLLEVEEQFSGILAGKTSITHPGSFVHSMFQSFRNPGVVKALQLLVEYTNSAASAAFSAKGRGVTRLLEFLTGAFNEHVTPEDLQELYKVHICREEKSEGGKGFLKGKSENTILHLWCFSPGFSMQRLARLGARSIILTSGTLSPLQATAEEIGIPFPVQLESKHIVTASQVWCGVLGTGPDGTKLNSSFKSRSDPKYLAALGQVIIMILKIVPKGVLVFFPSYSLLNSTREFWQNSGIWNRIDNLKRILVEPQRKDALSTAMKEYYEEVRTGRGGCFMAVCRGKVAEGLDFADDNGRAVLVTGLPYPPFKDARVELKRQFLDDQIKGKKGSMSGHKWYQLEAFRATNQAIGRVIRHSRDHGAVIFLDTRFGDHNAKISLSCWLQPFFQKYTSIGVAIKGLANFFKVDSSVGMLRHSAVMKQTALIEASRGIKRPLPQSDADSDKHQDDDQHALPLSELYQDKPQARQNVAQSIFSTSSASINFSSLPSRTTGSGVMAAPLPVGQKRKKIRLTSNKAVADTDNTGGDEGEESEVKTRNMAMEYVARLKRILGVEDMKQFKSAMQQYKVLKRFDALVPVLKNVILAHVSKDENLVEDFKVFIKRDHLSDFDLFCNVTAASL